MSIKALYPSTFPITQVDFSNKSFLPPEVEFSRGSSATYIGNDGLIKTALPGEPRFTHDQVSGEGLGLLVEEQRTNIDPNSLNQPASSLTYLNVNISITTGATAPDGTSNFRTFTTTSSTNQLRSFYSNPTSVTAGEVWTNSIYIDANNSSAGDMIFAIGNAGSAYLFGRMTINVDKTISISFQTAGQSHLDKFTPISSGYQSLGNNIYRVWYTYSVVYTGSPFLGMGLYPNSNRPLGWSISVWGSQVEKGSYPSSYIPTITSAVTRAADTFSIPVQNLKSSRIIFTPSSSTHSLTSPTLTFSDSTAPTPPYSLELSAPSLITTLVTKYNFIPQSYLSIPSYPPTTPPPSLCSVAFNYDATTGEMALATSAGEDSDAAVVSLPSRYNIPAPVGYSLDLATVTGSGILKEFYTWEETLSSDQLASIGKEYRAVGKNTYESSGLQPDLYELGGARPTLDLDFASRGDLKNAVNGEELITYSRGSAGTYYDSDGVLRTAIADEPRFDHDPVTGESLGLLVEEQRTNEIYNSDVKTYQTGQPFTTVGNIWQSCSNPNQGIITNITTTTTEEGPDGLFGVTKIAPNAGINYDFINFTVSDGFQIGFTFTGNNKAVTGFFKPSGCDVLNVRWGDYSTSRAVYTFDTSTLSATGSDASITSVANGWFKFTITNRTTQSLTFGCSKSNGDPNNGTDGVLLWGVQVEDNASFPTSYIPTAGGQGTRNADTVSITGTNFSSWFNQSEGTFRVRGQNDIPASAGSAGGMRFMSVSTGPSVYQDTTYSFSSNSASYGANFVVRGDALGNSTIEYNNLGWTNTFPMQTYVGGYDSTSSTIGYNNLSKIQYFSFALQNDLSHMWIGKNHAFDPNRNYINRISYWPKKLTDTSIRALTNPAIETWDIVFDSSLSANGTCAIITNSTCQYIVDWGDGTPTQTISASGAFTVTHRYVVPKKYSVKIDVVSGAFRPYYNNSLYADQLVEIGPSPDTWSNTSTSGFGTNLELAFYGSGNITSVSRYLDVSGVTSFSQAWYGCASLTSFPLLDTSSGTNFSQAWYGCASLTSFPLINTAAGTNFDAAWQSCTSLTNFPLLDTSSGTNFAYAWDNCTSLTSFPANMFNITGTLISTAFTGAFANSAFSAQSIENILVSLDTNGQSNITLGINGGTNAAKSTWSTAANTAYDNLIAKGWTITYNA